ncbi:SAM-DEPENDENT METHYLTRANSFERASE [Salix purpurea]|uniref:Methyltransferase n=1 Tax=Salix purpurea TaxID=77065 RepID=A0A9Q0PC68_SALPP|nr:SAM-DEPENDENT METHYLTRANSFERASE [Salix purpurea]
MVMGKYSRVDGRKPSIYCCTITVVVFVALCLVGAWMLMSSSVPVQNSNPLSQGNVNGVKQVAGENISKQFEDSPGDLLEDARKEDSNAVDSQSDSQSDVHDDQNDEKTVTEEEPKTRTENNKDGKTEDRESNSDDGEKNPDSGENANENKQEGATGNNVDSQENDQTSIEILPAGTQSELLNETNTQNMAWSTQVVESQNEKIPQQSSISKDQHGHGWKLCNVTAGPAYVPCLDNWYVIRRLPSTKHYEHRERHCPQEAPTCLVPIPEGYRRPVRWPKSREKSHPDIAWGKRSRVILDVGCGVASFGGYLLEKDVIAMSFAPKDEHEAQVQFALERGIPAMLAVMGTKRLPFPSSVFDLVHCARCRVPWHIEGGKLLLELNRVLRPGGYFIWSATPVYRNRPEDVGIWKAMSKLTKSMCWDLVVIKRDTLNGVGAAIYRKPTSNDCYNNRPQNEPPLCKGSDDPNAAWNVLLEACMHEVPVDVSVRGSRWPEQWPKRLEKPPYWLNSQVGVYGKAAPEDFAADYKHWKNVVSRSYLNGTGINWTSVRNIMDMRAVYGGLKKRCNLVAVIAEVDRILRPEGKLIVRDNVEIIGEIESLAKSLKWEIRMIYSKDKEGLLCVHKTMWRPTEFETITSAIIQA